MSRAVIALLAIVAVIGAGAGSGAGARPPARHPRRASPSPPIHKKLIPYPKKRKREMADYSKRHYGQHKWRLIDPKLIVIHYAEAGSISSIFNTFRTDHPDVEFHELPNVCSHYAVSASGGVYKFVPPTIRCRHTVGLNHVAIGVEHVGFSRPGHPQPPGAAERLAAASSSGCAAASASRSTGVIGHNESLSSPYLQGARPALQGPDPRRLEPRRHGDLPLRPHQARRLLSRECGSPSTSPTPASPRGAPPRS